MAEDDYSSAIEGILGALCDQVEEAPAGGAQRVFLIDDDIAAKLAFEVLVAFKIEAKVYHEDLRSKLYVAQSPPANFAADDAMVYARALRRIKDTVDLLETELDGDIADYSIAFANAQPTGKQILIQIKEPSASGVQSAAAHGPQRPAAAPLAANPKLARKKALAAKAAHQKAFGGGPALGKKYPKFMGGADARQDTLTKRAILYVTGNAATSGFAFLMMVVVVLAVLFSLFVMSKSFLCPDFATAKSKQSQAWYCQQD